MLYFYEIYIIIYQCVRYYQFIRQIFYIYNFQTVVLLQNDYQSSPKLFMILFPSRFDCSVAISGLLTIVDFISQTSLGTFFVVIGIALGYHDHIIAHISDLILHLLTGLTVRNIFGPVFLFWKGFTLMNLIKE